MRRIWTTALISFSIAGFAAVVSAAAIAGASDAPNIRTQGRAQMVEAQYRLAQAIGR